jgi:K+-transporting ATPase A subunit
MALIGWAQIAHVLACLVAAAILLGRYMAAVAAGRVTFLAPVERAFHAAAGIDPRQGQGWRGYTLALAVSRAFALPDPARRGLPGGVGSGLYGMLVFALLAVSVAGLMVGRTPEYLGKKVQAREVKLAVLVLPAAILGFTALVLPAAIASIPAAGPHGLSEMLYAYSSAASNNGSAFGGITADTPWMDVTLGIAMMLGRFAYVVPVMAIAGSLAAKPRGGGGGGWDLPDAWAALCQLAGRPDPDPRGAAIHACPRPWAAG